MFICTLICLAVFVQAAEPEVSFSVSQREVLLGDSIILTITVKGISNPQTPEIPAIPGFDVKFRGIRQESFSSFTVIVQGKKVQNSSSGGGYNFDYVLTPKKAGLLNIPSFHIQIGGKTYRTEALQIRVLDKSAQSDAIFIKVIADKKKVYLGEKLLVTFKWYINKDISEYRLNIPWLDGLKNFLVTDPEQDKQKKYQRLMVNGDQQMAALKGREIYKGQPYTVISFQKIIMPIAVGEYKLEPAFLKCEVVTGYKKSRRGGFDDFFSSGFDDFFGRGRNAVTESFATRSETVLIKVSEVPDQNKPVTYNGAVGDFKFTVDLKPVTLKAGEPITVTMKVSGSGNLEQLQLPVFPEIKDFKSYEPESRVNVLQKGGEVTGEKIFEKVLIPRHKGDYKIPQISFTFFNPKKKQYQTIKKGPFKVHVEKPDDISEVKVIAFETDGSEDNSKRKIKVLERDIQYIKTTLGMIVKSDKEIYKKPIMWIFFYGLPLFILAGLVFWKKRLDRFQTDIGFARSRKAFRNIKVHFQEAQKAIAAEDVREFYDSISKGMNNYMSDKLNCPVASVSSEIMEELYKKGLDAETVEELKRIYQIFEGVLFSSVKPGVDQLKRDYESVQNIIVILERVLK